MCRACAGHMQGGQAWGVLGGAGGNAARHVVDDQDAEGSGQRSPSNDPHNNQHNPQCANYWAPLPQKRHHKEHGPQRPTERSDPTQHVKGRTGDCPGPRKGTATQRDVTPGGGGGGEGDCGCSQGGNLPGWPPILKPEQPAVWGRRGAQIGRPDCKSAGRSGADCALAINGNVLPV